jgi:soluble lytic murein transglycosylase-like protein
MMATSPMRAAEPAVNGVETASPSARQQVIKVDRRTGKLVWGVAPEPRKAPAAASRARGEFAPLIERAARTHDLDPLLVDSVIRVESNYNAHAVSPKGAEGLMQLMPATARMLGVGNSFDPQENIEAGVRYLKRLKDLYQDDRLALAAYNAGPAAVEKFKWVPPYRETQNYVNEVGRRYGDARKAAESAAAPAERTHKQEENPSRPEEPTREYPKLERFVDEHGRLHLFTDRAQRNAPRASSSCREDNAASCSGVTRRE